MRNPDDGRDGEGERLELDGEDPLEERGSLGDRDGADGLGVESGLARSAAGDRAVGGQSGDDVPEIEADNLFDVLASQRRRVALHFLRDRGGAAQFDDLVDAIASHTVDGEPDPTDRRSIAGTLYHVHLPKLEDAGLIAEHDPEGEVRLSERVAGLPWSLLGSS